MSIERDPHAGPVPEAAWAADAEARRERGRVEIFNATRPEFQLPGTDDFVIADLSNADGTINIDPEGVTVDANGTTFWVASEGSGNLVGGVSDPSNRPFNSPNLIIEAELNPTPDIAPGWIFVV